MRSDKPKAKPFRQWVIKEVLPSIRKQGYYSFDNTPKLENYNKSHIEQKINFKINIKNLKERRSRSLRGRLPHNPNK
ncbi:hypothetical protein ACF10F_001720 [Campylobacter coli]